MQILINFAIVLGFIAIITGWFIVRRALDDHALQSTEDVAAEVNTWGLTR